MGRGEQQPWWWRRRGVGLPSANGTGFAAATGVQAEVGLFLAVLLRLLPSLKRSVSLHSQPSLAAASTVSGRGAIQARAASLSGRAGCTNVPKVPQQLASQRASAAPLVVAMNVGTREGCIVAEQLASGKQARKRTW